MWHQVRSELAPQAPVTWYVPARGNQHTHRTANISMSIRLLGLPWFWLSYSSSSSASPGHLGGQSLGEQCWTPAWESCSPLHLLILSRRCGLCVLFSHWKPGLLFACLRKNGPSMVVSQRPQTGWTEGKWRVTDFWVWPLYLVFALFREIGLVFLPTSPSLGQEQAYMV